jgi:hypothetical protein
MTKKKAISVILAAKSANLGGTLGRANCNKGTNKKAVAISIKKKTMTTKTIKKKAAAVEVPDVETIVVVRQIPLLDMTRDDGEIVQTFVSKSSMS